jgi:hypothetical protein
MADITFIDKMKLVKFLEMSSGYVMDFSNDTFQEFIWEAVGINIYDQKYEYRTGSKANRLKGFWSEESNFVVGKLVGKFLDYWMAKAQTGMVDYYQMEELYKECRSISERLMKDNIVDQIGAITAITDDKDFILLAKSIRESIEKNEPETALDRLHTYFIRFIRELCESHHISYDKNDSLNAIFGKYVKYLLQSHLIESLMSEKILRYSINILEAFNDIRNNKSFAHDNPILNYHESILIFNNISNSIKFIQTIENKNQEVFKEVTKVDWDDLPF